MTVVRIFVVMLIVGVSVAGAIDKQPSRQISEFTVGSDPEIFSSVELIPGGGALLSGFTSSTEDGYMMDAYLAQISATRQLVWETTVGDTLSEEFYHALPTSDGGYIAVGTSNSFGDKAFDMWVVRLDADRNELWSMSIGENPFGVATQVIPDGSGGWYIGGFQAEVDVWLADFRVIRMEDDGSILWDNTYGGMEHDFAMAMEGTSDGGVIIAGCTHSFSSENRDGYIVRVNSDGEQIWQLVIGGAWPDYVNDICRTSNGNYALVGTTHTSQIREESDMAIVLIDEDSNVLFQTTVGGDSWDEGWGICQLEDGGFFCVGNSYDPDSGVMNGYGVRLDEDGDILWQDATYGDLDGYQEFRDVVPWDDDLGVSDLVLAVGYTSSTDLGDADFYTRFIDVSEPGDNPIGTDLTGSVNLGQASPNPFNASTIFNVYLPTSMLLEVTVYNILGQEVRKLTRGRWAAGLHTFNWNADTYSSGTYIIEARTETQTLRQRIMLVK